MDTETQNAQKSARAMPENWPNNIERIRYVFKLNLIIFHDNNFIFTEILIDYTDISMKQKST